MQLMDVWINCPSNDVAQRIAEDLVDARLAACANIFGKVQSVYRWQGRIERESEVPLLLKIRESSFDAVVGRVTELHPYDVPPVIGVPVTRVNDDYRAWLTSETAES